MSWYESGGFRITRDKSMDSPANGIRFNASVYIGDGHTIKLALAKADVQGIKREAARVLKEQEDES